ncbi:MAG TPA: RNA polymerase subunit sigma-24 [Parvularcula sp.]|jgi:RNA polymerase sigma-70 factor (ECF subfamily)|nr:RNA polymerase subunit sigma-24 [Parvularcula sp.]HBS33446.1 RNA polymerase subunit sigma-24 [Parvularcula sp.]
MAGNETDDMRNRQAAVEAALRETRQDLFRFLVRRLRSQPDAADVQQDFYVKVLRSFPDLKDDDKLRPWMSKVLCSVIADHFRAQARQSQLEKDYVAEALTAAVSVEEEDVDLLVCVCLHKILPTLHDEYASLLWRTELMGETRDSVRTSLGLTENAFRVKAHRARKALRRRLEQSCEACLEHGFLNCGCEDVEALRRRLHQNPPPPGGPET